MSRMCMEAVHDVRQQHLILRVQFVGHVLDRDSLRLFPVMLGQSDLVRQCYIKLCVFCKRF